MTDQTDVREFLHRMANEAGFAPVKPGPVVRKARRRMARTVGGTLLMAGALVAGALVAANGLMNAARTQMPQPGGQPTPTTTENGQAVSEPYSILDGEVTFDAAPPWDYSFAGWDHLPGGIGITGPETMTTLLLDRNYDERVAVLADPLPVQTGCEEGPAPAHAEALARTIRSDPDLGATEPVSVSVGGIEGLRMDVVAAPGASVCDVEGHPQVLAAPGLNGRDHFGVEIPVGHRMRLYLLDLSGGSARMLAIAIVAPEASFEHVVEAAAPIVDSFEFRTG
jgi:hypothetical protein